MKVIVTKQGEEGEGSQIIDEGQYGPDHDRKLPLLNEPSIQVLRNVDEIHVAGTEINEGSEVNLSAGKLGISQSVQKVQLP